MRSVSIPSATQRPTTNIITGTIKANFPARIAFRVAAMMDSRTILDRSGAQQLTGPGDMLVSHGRVESKRLQAAITDREDIASIVQQISAQHSHTSTYPLPEAKVKESPHANMDMNRLDQVLHKTAGMGKSKSPDIEEVRETIEGLKRGICKLEKWIDD